MKWFKSLSIYFKTCIISLLILVIAMSATAWCYFYSLMEIPNGVALGMVINIMFQLIFGIVDAKDNKKSATILTTIFTAVRMLFVGGILFLVAFLYYKEGIKIFNIFAVVGGYFVPLIVLLIFALIKGKDAKRV